MCLQEGYTFKNAFFLFVFLQCYSNGKSVRSFFKLNLRTVCLLTRSAIMMPVQFGVRHASEEVRQMLRISSLSCIRSISQVTKG